MCGPSSFTHQSSLIRVSRKHREIGELKATLCTTRMLTGHLGRLSSNWYLSFMKNSPSTLRDIYFDMAKLQEGGWTSALQNTGNTKKSFLLFPHSVWLEMLGQSKHGILSRPKSPEIYSLEIESFGASSLTESELRAMAIKVNSQPQPPRQQ